MPEYPEGKTHSDRGHLEWIEGFEKRILVPFKWAAVRRIAEAGVFSRLPFNMEKPDRPNYKQRFLRDLSDLTYVWYRMVLGMRSIIRYIWTSGLFPDLSSRTATYLMLRQFLGVISDTMQPFPEKNIDEILEFIAEMLMSPALQVAPGRGRENI